MPRHLVPLCSPNTMPLATVAKRFNKYRYHVPPLMKIDSHQHFWKYDSAEYGWISEEHTVLKRDFLPVDLEPLMAENNIDGCIAVQARQTIEETEWLLEISEANHRGNRMASRNFRGKYRCYGGRRLGPALPYRSQCVP